MAALEVSEFTFGFAFLHEQVNASWGELKSVPVLPSLADEKGKGWDAHLPKYGSDVYFQFKISKFLAGKTAKFIKDGTYSEPYYRIDLHHKHGNNQHKLLRRLAGSSPETFYVGTEVKTEAEFERAFMAGTVIGNSRLIPLAKCSDLKDSAKHSISFQTGDAGFIEHSEPREREGSLRGEELNSVLFESRERWRSIDQSFGVQLLDRLRSTILGTIDTSAPLRDPALSRLLNEGVQGWTLESTLGRASALALVALDASMVIVGQP